MSAFTAVYDNLLTALKASTDLSGVAVYDSIQWTAEDPVDAVAVGHDGSMEDDDVNQGSVSSEYVTLGAKAKYERGSINCFLFSTAGDTDTTTRRQRALTLFNRVEQVVKADPTVGGACMIANVAQGDIRLRQTTQGVAVLITFTVTYEARLS